ncbi:MAG: YgiQ family radical SAM protein, partial [Bacillota bacterium]|nr:YgiQ family radical SAM protein [Bacillota bacterium]
FAAAILSRVLESYGFKVAIIAQPGIKNTEDIKKCGTPRLGVFISGGNIDSMVAHYTAAKRKRSEDMYSPGGKAGRRPDRPTIVYSRLAKEAFPGVPVIIGGIEASLRRFAHYDYWEDRVMPSILFDSGADLLTYGMGERIIKEIAFALNEGLDIKSLTYIDGTVYASDDVSYMENAVTLPSYEDVCRSKTAYAKSVAIQYNEHDFVRGKTVIQPHGDKFLVQNKPAAPLSRSELDRVFSLPFTREVHPTYEKMGGVPAIEEVKFSITSSRGCFGACNFCALAFHQGKTVQSRSHKSIITEAKKLVHMPDFKGYINDVGGPTANFRSPSCSEQMKRGVCPNKQCLFPKPCKNLEVSHKEYIELLRQLREIDGIKKVFIRSGIRFDYLMADKDKTFLDELCNYHISGQLKVAPEHVSDNVLRLMGKPENKVYQQFCEAYKRTNEKLGKEQYLVPYLMSSHPGSTLNDAVALALYLKKEGINPQQVQDFYPTPGTISTCMYYTGINPRTMEHVYVARSPEEKAMQRALLQYRRPENYELVRRALIKTGRKDLIGFGSECLIKPKINKSENTKSGGYVNGKNNRRKGSGSKNKGGVKGNDRRVEGRR